MLQAMWTKYCPQFEGLYALRVFDFYMKQTGNNVWKFKYALECMGRLDIRLFVIMKFLLKC